MEQWELHNQPSPPHAGFEKNDVENQHTRDPIFSWTVTPDRCANKTWKQQPFSLELLCWVKPAFEASGWAAVLRGEGSETECGGGESERGMVEWEHGDK